MPRGVVAALLVVTMSACGTTTAVRVPSAELTDLNLRAHGTRSRVTLRDGRQMDVQGLQINVDEARGQLLRERTVDAEGEPTGPWQGDENDPRPLSVPAGEIRRVVLRTDRGKGAAIGGISGAVVGAAVGGGIGYAARKENPPCYPFAFPPQYWAYVCEQYSDVDPLEAASATVLGMIVGASVLGLTGLFVGLRGRERTYEFDAGAATPPSTTPSGGTAEPALSLGR